MKNDRRFIGVLATDMMGGMSQAHCLQRMREAGFSTTVVVSKYFSTGVRADFKVSNLNSLVKVLDKNGDDDAIVFSRAASTYGRISRDPVPRRGMAHVYAGTLALAEAPMTRKIAETAMSGGVAVFTVGSLRDAVLGNGSPDAAALSVPGGILREWPEKQVSPRMGILMSHDIPMDARPRCLAEFRAFGVYEVSECDIDGPKNASSALSEVLAALLRPRCDSNDGYGLFDAEGFDDRVVLVVTDCERMAEMCSGLRLRRGRFRMFGADGSSSDLPAYRFNPDEMARYRNFAAYAGDLLKAVRIAGAEGPTPAVEVDTPAFAASERPPLTVAFMTHDRTAVACKCLEMLCRKLRYAGDIHYCVCDDRSRPGHVEALERVLRECGRSYSVERNLNGRWGLGASMNNGLRNAFSRSPVVLTSEDDFLLEREFDITGCVDTIMSNDVAGIRLAYVKTKPSGTGVTWTRTRPSKIKGFVNVVAGSVMNAHYKYVFNNQVMLRHKRVYDAIGYYPENCNHQEMERQVVAAYAVRFKGGLSENCQVLYPDDLPTDTYDNGLFMHIGESTAGHGFAIPEEYVALNDADADKRLRDQASDGPAAESRADGADGPFFRIITPVRNRAACVRRLAEALDRQSFRDFEWHIGDDASDDDTRDAIAEVSEKRPWVRFALLDKRSCAGGARNVALDIGTSRYTLYMDVDDDFASPDALQAVHDAVVAAGYPDAVALSYYWGSMKKVRTEWSPQELVRHNQAPWTVCHRTSLSRRFMADRYRFNDVVWFMRLCDAVKTVAPCATPWYVYSPKADGNIHENAADGTRRCAAARLQLSGDLLSEEFSHGYVAAQARKIAADARQKAEKDLRRFP